MWKLVDPGTRGGGLNSRRAPVGWFWSKVQGDLSLADVNSVLSPTLFDEIINEFLFYQIPSQYDHVQDERTFPAPRWMQWMYRCTRMLEEGSLP